MRQDDIHREPPAPSQESWRRQTTFNHVIDLGERLPEPARAKLERLRTETADLAAISSSAYAQMRENHVQCDAIKLRLYELDRREGLAPDHPLVRAERESLEKFKATGWRLSVEAEARKEKTNAARLLVQAVEKYISRLPPGSIALAPPLQRSGPELAKGETPAQAVEKLRAKIEALREDLQSALDAPIHSDEAKRIARAYVERLAEMGRPNVLVTLEGRRPPKFAEVPAAPRVGHDAAGESIFLSVDDSLNALAALAWIDKDRMIAGLEREIDAVADDESALSDEERAERTAQCKTEILKTERDEETAIEAASSIGQRIARRVDADPRAVLLLGHHMPEPESN